MKQGVALAVMIGLSGLCGCAGLPKLAVSRDTLTPEEHTSLGNTYLANKEKPAAAAQFQVAIRQDRRHVPALLALGNMAFEDKRMKEARGFFEKALKAAPGDAAALNNLAMVELAEGKLKEAGQRAQEALSTGGPLKPYVLDTLANIALKEGRFEDAQNFLHQAAAQAPAGDAEFDKHLQESRQNLATVKNNSK